MLIKWLILISDGPGEAKKLAFFAPKSWSFWPLAQILQGGHVPPAPPIGRIIRPSRIVPDIRSVPDTDEHTNEHTNNYTNKITHKPTLKHKYRHTYGKHKHEHTDRYANKHTHKRTNKNTYKHTNKHTHKRTNIRKSAPRNCLAKKPILTTVDQKNIEDVDLLYQW